MALPSSRTLIGAADLFATGRQIGLAKTLAPTNDPRLVTLQRAWANRTFLPLKALFVGDSHFAYAFANRAFSTAMSDAMNPPSRQLQTWAASGTIFPGDEVWGVGGSSPTWSTTTGVVQGDKVANRGRSGDAIALANLDDMIAPSIICSSVTAHWLTPLSGAGATYDFYIDGVVVAAGISSAAAGSYTIDMPTDGAHILKVVSNGVNLFDCFDVNYGNELSGWQPRTWANSAEVLGAFNGYTDFDEALAATSPDVIFIEPFTNYAVTAAATMFNDLVTFLATCRANSDASIVIALTNATIGDTSWALFEAYVRRAAVLYNCYLVEIGDTIPDLAHTAATWTRVGTVVTFDLPAHYLQPGDFAQITASSATTPVPNATYFVDTVPDTDTFTSTAVNSGATSGTATVVPLAFLDASTHYTLMGRALVSAAMMQGVFGGRNPARLRSNTLPLDILVGPDRNERRVACSFETLSPVTPITVSDKIPGTEWTVGLSGAGSQLSQAEAADLKNGSGKLETGTTAAGFGFVIGGTAVFTFNVDRRAVFGLVYKIPVVSTALETFTARWGFLSSFTGVPTGGMYFRQDDGVANYLCVTRVGGVETATDSGVAVTTGFRQTFFFYDPIRQAVDFYIANTLVATNTTNIPAAAALLPGFNIISSVGTTSKAFHADLASAVHLDPGNLNPLFP